MTLKTRNPQTQVKHLILSKYLDDWAGIIINGIARVAQSQISRGLPFHARLLYVDGFSYTGRYLGDTSKVLAQDPVDTPTWGSPILGIQALERARQFAWEKHGFSIETAVILVEQDPGNFKHLLESVALAGFAGRLVANPPKIRPQNGEILAIQGDFLNWVQPVMQVMAERYVWTFCLLDPYGPTGIPYDNVVKPIIAQDRVDVMINFPYYDLHKKQGILKRAAELPLDQALLENYDAVFGTPYWREVRKVVWERTGTQRSLQLESELARFYLTRLQAADPGLAVRHIQLTFPDREQTIFYLYLTTHDPSGALKLNEVLHTAKIQERVLKWEYREALWLSKARQIEQIGQPSLFDVESDAPPPAPADARQVDVEALADAIWTMFQGKVATKKAVYTAIVNSEVFAWVLK